MVSLREELKAYGDALKDVQMDGLYTLQAVKGNANPTSTGKDSINILFRVISAEHKGQEVYNMFSHSPGNEQAAKFFFKRLAQMGITEKLIEDEDPDFDELAARIVRDGVTIKAVVKYDEQYGNKIKNITETVKGIKPRGGAAGKSKSAAGEDGGEAAVIPAGEEMSWDE